MNLAGLRERWAAAPVPHAPDLRLVAERPGHTGRTYLVVLVLSLLFLILFGLAVFHTVLIGAQGRLDRLDSKIAEEQDLQRDLRLQVAELQSPERIVEAATDDLGMVPPGEVVWLTPTDGVTGTGDGADEERDEPDASGGTSSRSGEIAAGQDAGGEDR